MPSKAKLKNAGHCVQVGGAAVDSQGTDKQVREHTGAGARNLRVDVGGPWRDGLCRQASHRAHLKQQRRAHRSLALRLFGLLLAVATLMLYEVARR